MVKKQKEKGDKKAMRSYKSKWDEDQDENEVRVRNGSLIPK